MKFWMLWSSILLGAVIGLLALLIAFGRQADAAEPRPSSPPLRFEGPQAERYWGALMKCSKELDDTNIRLDAANIRLAGALIKVRTATQTIMLSCPVLPATACPVCAEQSCLLAGIEGAGIGVLLTGGVCALAMAKQGGVTFVNPSCP